MSGNVFSSFSRAHAGAGDSVADYCSALEKEQSHLSAADGAVIAAALEVANAKKELFSTNMVSADKCCCRRVLRFLHLCRRSKASEEERRLKYAEALDRLTSVCQGAPGSSAGNLAKAPALEDAHHQLLDHIQWLLGTVAMLSEQALAEPSVASLAEDVTALIKQLKHEGLTCIFYSDTLSEADKRLFDRVHDETVSGHFMERPAILRGDVVVLRGTIVTGE